MLCSKCGHELTEEMFLNEVCYNCGAPVSESKRIHEAEQTRKAAEAKAQRKALAQQEKEFLSAKKQNRYSNHLTTAGFTFEGFSITKYIGMVSGETVVSPGTWPMLKAAHTEFVNQEYSDRVKAAKSIILDNMITESVNKGGNAIIGVSYEMVVFHDGLLGVSVNGTSVIVEPTQ